MYKFEKNNKKERKEARRRSKNKKKKNTFSISFMCVCAVWIEFFLAWPRWILRGEWMRGLENFPFQITFFYFLFYLFNVKMLCVGANIMKKVSFFCLLHVVENLACGGFKEQDNCRWKTGGWGGYKSWKSKKETICYIWGYAV